MDLNQIIEIGGLAGIYAIIFAESGLFFGFFLPGDSLLFTAGVFASQGYFSITALVIGSWIFAILGDTVGYSFGAYIGPKLFNKQDSRFFHKEHPEKARAFYAKHGPKAIILARFIPVIRTFVPIIAGVGKMHYRTFLIYNIVGATLAVWGITLAGYFLGRSIPNIDSYIVPIIVIIIVISFIPVIREYFHYKRQPKS